MYKLPFEKLEVWQMSKKMVMEVYAMTKRLPDGERFGLIQQMNRSAISVAANLAEGNGRLSRKDQAHFSQLAYSSLMELACHYMICEDLGYLNCDNEFRQKILKVANKINALRNYQLRK